MATAAVAMEVHSFVSPRSLAMLLLHQANPPPPLLVLAVPIPLALWLLPSSRLSSRHSTEGSGNSWFPPRLELQLWEVEAERPGEESGAGFFKENDGLEARGLLCTDRIFVSDCAHLLFNLHQTVDGLPEAELGVDMIGTTKRGISVLC
ncbi:unnamed protein product [Sphagnum troendelagicum]|uniref:Uncharacterized protein n=1 Tax=Sphagnum troendelagicum TaxID=128251 RepID=A0ABP0UVR0_9BRYO